MHLVFPLSSMSLPEAPLDLAGLLADDAAERDSLESELAVLLDPLDESGGEGSEAGDEEGREGESDGDEMEEMGVSIDSEDKSRVEVD